MRWMLGVFLVSTVACGDDLSPPPKPPRDSTLVWGAPRWSIDSSQVMVTGRDPQSPERDVTIYLERGRITVMRGEEESGARFPQLEAWLRAESERHRLRH